MASAPEVVSLIRADCVCNLRGTRRVGLRPRRIPTESRGRTSDPVRGRSRREGASSTRANASCSSSRRSACRTCRPAASSTANQDREADERRDRRVPPVLAEERRFEPSARALEGASSQSNRAGLGGRDEKPRSTVRKSASSSSPRLPWACAKIAARLASKCSSADVRPLARARSLTVLDEARTSGRSSYSAGPCAGHAPRRRTEDRTLLELASEDDEGAKGESAEDGETGGARTGTSSVTRRGLFSSYGPRLRGADRRENQPRRSSRASDSTTGSPSNRSTARRFAPPPRTCATSASSAGRSHSASGSGAGRGSGRHAPRRERPPRRAARPRARDARGASTRAPRPGKRRPIRLRRVGGGEDEAPVES